MTTVRSFLEVDNPRPREPGTSSAGVVGPASKVAEEGRCGVAPVAVPGCLKMPKFSDFLCGCMLHDIVCPAETLTQRTRYDWCLNQLYSPADRYMLPCCGLRCSPFPPYFRPTVIAPLIVVACLLRSSSSCAGFGWRRQSYVPARMVATARMKSYFVLQRADIADDQTIDGESRVPGIGKPHGRAEKVWLQGCAYCRTWYGR
jgi:hypothetical protein